MTREWFEKVAYHSLGHRTSQEMTYDVAKLALEHAIPGDFVECGVYAGASCALMARAMMDHHAATVDPPFMRDLKRRVHLFDSFAGLPHASIVDTEIFASHPRGGQAVCPLEGVKENMRAWGIPDELLVYHPGWFTDTMALWHRGQSVKQIAVLRIDCDLYQSTFTVMEHLYPLLSPGAYVIADDYNLSGFRRAIHDHVMPAPIYWRKES